MTFTDQQKPDGTWQTAERLQGTRWYRIEAALRRRGFRRIAALMGRLDERGLRG